MVISSPRRPQRCGTSWSSAPAGSNALIHGGGRRREELHPDLVAAPAPDGDLLALDAALAKFAERDPLKARLVELRFFAGLTGDQAAEILGISPSTADRHWIFARAWLRREIKAGKALEEN